MQLCEKYRPRTWEQFIGQDAIIRRIRWLLDRPEFGATSGDALWISGLSGAGKTSLALLIAQELGADGWASLAEYEGKHINASAVKDIEHWLWLCAPSGGWKVAIVNEGQSIRDGAVEAFLTLLDTSRPRLPAHRLVIFTSTSDLTVKSTLFGDEFTGPLARRCKQFAFTNQGLCKPFAARVREIAEREGINGLPLARYERFVAESGNNLGDAIQRLSAGELLAD